MNDLILHWRGVRSLRVSIVSAKNKRKRRNEWLIKTQSENTNRSIKLQMENWKNAREVKRICGRDVDFTHLVVYSRTKNEYVYKLHRSHFAATRFTFSFSLIWLRLVGALETNHEMVVFGSFHVCLKIVFYRSMCARLEFVFLSFSLSLRSHGDGGGGCARR